MYRDLLKNSSDDFEQERLTNLQASAVFVQNAPVADESQDESYELCYNRGCQLLGEQKWSQAEDALKKAEEMCKTDMKEDEADDEEIVEISQSGRSGMVGGWKSFVWHKTADPPLTTIIECVSPPSQFKRKAIIVISSSPPLLISRP